MNLIHPHKQRLTQKIWTIVNSLTYPERSDVGAHTREMISVTILTIAIIEMVDNKDIDNWFPALAL